MTKEIGSNGSNDDIRDLAGQGDLAQHMKTASKAEVRRLRIQAYELVWPIVFEQLTRRLEIKRGHPWCASSVHKLEPDCLDRFHEDVEAVLDDLFRNAKTPIHNLEGWVSSRLVAATVNAYRRRRGERGALQRPRIPMWLAAGLGNDPELMTLAVEMLEWVGVDATAGAEIWPVAAWAQRRAAVTGDYDAALRDVADDVVTVITAMQRRPLWYAKFVERPLGRKTAPLLLPGRNDTDAGPASTYIRQSGATHDADDAHLAALASAAVAAIETRLARGEDPRTVVVDVLWTVFGSGTGAEDLGRFPGHASEAHEIVTELLADPSEMDRIVSIVLDLLSSQAP